MPETDDETRARQAAIEQAARARLHGVEMPKRLDFTSKKLHHEYLCFKTLAEKVFECYDGLEDSVKVNKVLMWMGPEACVKHDLHPFPPGDKENSPRCGTSLTTCVPRRKVTKDRGTPRE